MGEIANTASLTHGRRDVRIGKAGDTITMLFIHPQSKPNAIQLSWWDRTDCCLHERLEADGLFPRPDQPGFQCCNPSLPKQ